MPAATLPCPHCQSALVIEPGLTEASLTCPTCTSLIEAYFFPGFFRPIESGTTASALIDHTEASCFYHPQKQAQRVCDGCGRLICALCSIELGEEHLCPNCLASGKKKGRIVALEDSRTPYDKMALTLSILSVLLMISVFFLAFSVIPAVIAIYLSIRYWNSPGSILGVSKTRFVIAILLAIIPLLIMTFGLLSIILLPYLSK